MDEGLRGQGPPLVEREAAVGGRRQGSRSTSPGTVTIATEGWFFAAARTMVGPPMSICSTHSSGVAPDITVSVNG